MGGDVIVPKSQDFEPSAPEPLISYSVLFFMFRMLSSVKFYDKLFLIASKVHYILAEMKKSVDDCLPLFPRAWGSGMRNPYEE
jgi:hypothetical protein